MEATSSAARAALPWWVPWAPVLYALVLCAALGLLLAWLSLWVAARYLRRLPAEAHWSERAALSWPVRNLAAANLIFFFLAGALLAHGFAGPFAALGETALMALGGLAAALGP